MAKHPVSDLLEDLLNANPAELDEALTLAERHDDNWEELSDDIFDDLEATLPLDVLFARWSREA